MDSIRVYPAVDQPFGTRTLCPQRYFIARKPTPKSQTHLSRSGMAQETLRLSGEILLERSIKLAANGRKEGPASFQQLSLMLARTGFSFHVGLYIG